MKGAQVGRRDRIRGVLFDFDGTLTLPGALDFSAIKREMACPQDTPILEYLDTQPHSQRPRLLGILGAREEEAALQSFPNRGAEACLSALKERGILFGIITRNSLRSVLVALENFKRTRADDFAVIVTREDARPKPHPDGVHWALNRMGLPISDLMLVGDFRFDVMAGRAAGVKTVLLTNSRRSSLEPDDPAPDYLVEYLEDILEIIAQEGSAG